jgi:type II secretory pathway component PulK
LLKDVFRQYLNSTENLTTGEKGQALITLLFFIIVAVTITSGAVIVILTNSSATNQTQQGIIALSTAESGAENALLRLLRDPDYSGETVAIGEGTAQISVTGSGNKTITVEGNNGGALRKIQVETSYNNNILTLISWKETF